MSTTISCRVDTKPMAEELHSVSNHVKGTTAAVTLHVPRLKGVSFETAIIERYRRRESSISKPANSMSLLVILKLSVNISLIRVCI